MLNEIKNYPKIRFKGFVEPWNNVEYGFILAEFSDKSTTEDEYPLLSSTTQQIELRDGRVSGQSNIGYKIIDNDDLILSPQNLWLGNININEIGEGIVSPSYKTFKIINADVKFLKQKIKTSEMMKEYKNSSTQGASVVRRNLEIDLFNKISFKAPQLVEQQKIGKFFEKLDELITLETKKSEKLRNIKSSLLNSMFC